MARAVLARVDGLRLAGGADPEPGPYGAAAHREPAVAAARPRVFELALARQVMAVAEGGHLEQYVPDWVAHHDHAPALGVWISCRADGAQEPRLQHPRTEHDGAEPSPSGRHNVPRVRPVGLGQRRTLEALEDSRAKFRIGVQWHPEAEHDNRLVGALVHEARDGLG